VIVLTKIVLSVLDLSILPSSFTLVSNVGVPIEVPRDSDYYATWFSLVPENRRQQEKCPIACSFPGVFWVQQVTKTQLSDIKLHYFDAAVFLHYVNSRRVCYQ
jgi:hypothetical protein